jgi:pimeloyl-ACP methyl ester carboxylesterase
VTSLAVRGRLLEAMWWEPDDPPAADASPIVMLHEGLGSVSMWRDFPGALAVRTGRRVMAYSRFGHGRSARPQSPPGFWSMHEEAALLPEILDAAAIKRAILFGHSDGGSIAIISAAEHPERVNALVLEAPHVFVEDLSVASIERTNERYAAGDLRTRLAQHHDDVDVAFSGWRDVWLDPAFRAWNLEAFLPHVTGPTLLIQGEEDQYGTLQQVDAIVRQSGGPVDTLVLPDCRHSPHRDQREAVLSTVCQFISTTTTTP